MTIGNLFENIPKVLPKEITTVLQSGENIRIERIVSAGHKSPADFWYEQAQHEWVIVLEGSAVIAFASGEKETLAAGGYMNIPKGIQHRVDATDKHGNTVWLAVFY